MPTEDRPDIPPTLIELDDLLIAIQSTRWMIYQAIGCPMGDTYAGFQVWAATAGQRFVNFCGGSMEEQEPTTEETLDYVGQLVSALAYQFYKSLGCPHGAGIAGFERWAEIIQDEFSDVLEVDSRE